jgi:hypothetical protein
LALVAPAGFAGPQEGIPSPADFFGFEMGADEQLARWDKMLEYFDLVAERSDRIRVDDLGATTLGNRFITVVITSPENFAEIDRYVEIGRRLADGRGVSEAEARELAREGKVTVVLNNNIHSTEIASSQGSVRLAYEMATEDTELMRQILDNVIFVMVPSANPDGQIMVTDWYNQNLGTDFEEAPMPWLYHHYAGHDNNRDFFMGNLVETRHLFRIMFDDWAPQIYYDQHQMGSGGARMFVPPFPDPQSPDIPPLLFQQVRLLGGAMVTDLQAAGKKGVLTGETYRIYGQEGALNYRFHNIVSMMTETASARIASPVEQEDGGEAPVRRGSRDSMVSPREFSVTVVDPWREGTWRLAEIVDYQVIAVRALLKQAARSREDFLFNQWLMAQETFRRAEEEGPYAWVIPADQHDPLTTADMVRRLMLQGIEVYQAAEPFEAIPATGPLPTPWLDPLVLEEESGEEGEMEVESEAMEEAEEAESEAMEEAEEAEATEEAAEVAEAAGEEAGRTEETGEKAEAQEGAEAEVAPEPVTYAAGSYVIPGAQRGRPSLIDLLEPRKPVLRRVYPDGPYLRRYDTTGYTLPMQMGVDIARVDTKFDAAVEIVDDAVPPMPSPPTRAEAFYVLDGRLNASFKAVNRLLADGVAVLRSGGSLATDAGNLPAGAFLIPASEPGIHERIRAISEQMRLPVFADPEAVRAAAGAGAAIGSGTGASAIRVARIALYKPWRPSMDEGWTRYLLEQFEFPFHNVDNARIRAGALGADYDVLIIPRVSLDALLEGIDAEDIMEPYAGGIGEEGLEALQAFVAGGGTLLTFERADQVVLEHFEVPVKDGLEGLEQPDFFLPPALLRIEVDTEHPLAHGMPHEATAMFAGGRAYEPDGWDAAAGSMRAVATYPEEGRVLASGQLVGDEYLAGRAAVLEVQHGEGRIVMYGFRVQHRAQSHGTFKLVFNALYTTE